MFESHASWWGIHLGCTIQDGFTHNPDFADLHDAEVSRREDHILLNVCDVEWLLGFQRRCQQSEVFHTVIQQSDFDCGNQLFGYVRFVGSPVGRNGLGR